MLYFLTNDINNPRVEKVITSLDKFYKDKLVILNNKIIKGLIILTENWFQLVQEILIKENILFLN